MAHMPLKLPNKSERRHFIGGSDARIIMGNDEPPFSACGARSAAKSSRRTSPAISLSSLASSPSRSTAAGSNATPGSHQGYPTAGPASGRALDGRDPRRHGRATGAVFEAKFMLPWSFSEEGGGRKIHAAAAAQYVGHQRQAVRCSRSSPAAANGSRSRSRRPALPAPPPYGGEEVLALRRERRAPSPVRR